MTQNFHALQTDAYAQLLNTIGEHLGRGRQEAIKRINHELLKTYWQIGKDIVEFEEIQQQNSVAYNGQFLTLLGKDLKQEHGKGFSKSNLNMMRQFYIRYPDFDQLSTELSWSIYCELLVISDDLARSFYEKQCILENWSVKELKRQINTSLFERLALSRDKEGVLELAKEGLIVNQPQDVIKDPYIFEFLDLSDKLVYTERDLENQLVEKLAKFLMELGKGFAFIGQQYRVTLNNTHYYVDLVFYHHILKCFVLFDLKRGKVNHQDIGQMNLYLNYFKHEENTEGDTEPIGIVLAAGRDEVLVEYALGGITNQLFVSKYQIHLPDLETLKQELELLLDEDEKN